MNVEAAVVGAFSYSCGFDDAGVEIGAGIGLRDCVHRPPIAGTLDSPKCLGPAFFQI